MSTGLLLSETDSSLFVSSPFASLLQMLKSLEDGGLGPVEVRILWDLYQKARQHEAKAEFGQGECDILKEGGPPKDW